MDKAKGRNLLREAERNDEGYPAAGGYEEYPGTGHRMSGWEETYTGSKEDAVESGHKSQRIRVTVRLPTGVEMDRIYSLEEHGVRVQSVVTNHASESQAIGLRGRPEWMVAKGANAKVVYALHAGDEKTIDTSKPGDIDIHFGGVTTKDGGWTVDLGDVVVRERYTPDDVGQLALHGNPSAGWVATEVFGRAKWLGPGERVKLEASWEISDAK
jgi:hypothetical protein